MQKRPLAGRLTLLPALLLCLLFAGCGGANDTFSPTVENAGAAMPDFSLSAAPTTLTVTRGQTATYIITVTSLAGFSSSVALSATVSPQLIDGERIAFAPVTVSPADGTTSTLTITTTSDSQPRACTITITGMSGATTHSKTVTLTIAPPGGLQGIIQ